MYPRLKPGAYGLAVVKVASEQKCYHVWFATKSRKWLLVGEIEDEVKKLLRQIATDREIQLLACETMVDHVHLLLKVGPNELSKTMFLLKGISSRRVFQAFPGLKLDAKTESFWQARYRAKVIPEESLRSVEWYIETQKERPEKYGR